MTLEQVKGLQPGDVVWLRGFVLVEDDVVIHVKSPTPVVFGGLVGNSIKFSHENPYTEENACKEFWWFVFLTGTQALSEVKVKLQEIRDSATQHLEDIILEEDTK